MELGCERGVGGDEGLVGDGVFIVERREGENGLEKEVQVEEEGWSGSGVSEQSGSDREGRTEAGTLLLRLATDFSEKFVIFA